MRTVRTLSGWGLVGIMLTGCAIVTPMEGYQPDGRYCFRQSKKKVCTDEPAPSAEDEAKAKQFVAPADMQVVWLVRNTKWDFHGRGQVTAGAQRVVTLPYTVSRFTLRPGLQRLTLRLWGDSDEIVIDGKAGDQTFVEVVADAGLVSTQFSLRRLPEDEGRRKALASKLISDIRPHL